MQKTDSKIVWLPPPEVMNLHPLQVDVWRVFLDLPVEINNLLESTLSAGESRRAARFHFAADRDRYIAAHGSLRDVLARYLHCEPHQLIFSIGEYGKPALQSTEGIDFNLAHSGDYALIAVTRGLKVGVDVERIRQDLELESVARRYFSQREVSELLVLPTDLRKIAFFNCWTRKEAYIKAKGLGLSLPLNSFDVSLTANEPAILQATRPDPQDAAQWTLLPLEVDPAYAAALAVEGKELEIGLWDWNIV